MDKRRYRVGMAQILVEGGRPDANLGRAVRAIGEAAAQGCRLVVLPECLDLGWTDPSARDLARPIPGPHAERLAQAAREHRIYVAAGLVERAGDRLYNAAVLIDPEGRILLHHRKINELDIALDLYSIGDRLGVVETELGTVGLATCADNFGSSLAIGHVLARMGAQLILSPSAWAVDADHDDEHEPYGKLWLDSYSELARLYDVTVDRCQQRGLDDGRALGGPQGHRLLAGGRAGRRGPGAGAVRRARRGAGRRRGRAPAADRAGDASSPKPWSRGDIAGLE